MQLERHFLENAVVIGDVHGCYFTLQKLIRQFPKDALCIFVGDLCDKGNFSKQVIDLVIENKYLCVKGNHEHLYEKYILDAMEKDIHVPWSSDKRYGGLQTIQSYEEDLESVKRHLRWIEQLPMYIQIGRYFITHGFALELYAYKDETTYYNDFLLNRFYEDSEEPTITEDIINIFGHSPFSKVQAGEKFFCLDTGCVNGGKLSAYAIAEDKIYEEVLDARDSDYSLKELQLRDINLDAFHIDAMYEVTLQEGCRYKDFDVVSNEVLEYMMREFPQEAKSCILGMKERSVIFPKQVDKVFNKQPKR